ncbi:MAG TPA: hypothetical protein VLG14_19885 [Sphingomonas sp.]|nr:hypothetical protein [Sphingomonas sp.]
MTDDLPWRPEFLAALRLLGRISDAMAARGLPRPVLVGGGAVEFYTGSAVMTGDIDLTTPVQAELEEEMLRAGFIRPRAPGHVTLGWLHPELGLGFEVVGSRPMDGNVPATQLVLVEPVIGAGEIVMLSIEDMIADRMGQYASGTAPDMLEQARALYRLHLVEDRAYLDARIRTESAGDYGIEHLDD